MEATILPYSEMQKVLKHYEKCVTFWEERNNAFSKEMIRTNEQRIASVKCALKSGASHFVMTEDGNYYELGKKI